VDRARSETEMAKRLQDNQLRCSRRHAQGRHEPCLLEGRQVINPLEATMRWTKPEAEIVAVTMEVTAYVATL
jgi:coenzyme PQQ precursor peptide PqqA